MQHYWAILRYACPLGHENGVSRIYSEESEDAVLRKIDSTPLTCYHGHFGPISPRPVKVSIRILPLSPSQFAELGDVELGKDRDAGVSFDEKIGPE